ncbi:hypothetical protein D3C71_22110 [compost metagenome]
MRATSPKDALGAVHGIAPLPQPKLAIGTRLDLSKVVGYKRAYLIRKVKREVIQRLRVTIDRMQRDGYFPEMKGRKMLDCHKQNIRGILQFMETADSVEVAGHAPWEAQSQGNIANQCYIVGGPGFSGWSFGVYVLFRKEVDGKRLIYTHPEPLMCEHSASFCAIPA